MTIQVFSRKIVISLILTLLLLGVLGGGALLFGADTTSPATDPAAADSLKWGLIAAAAAFGMGAIGAGIAIANVGSAAMGAIAEKPEIASQALIFIALAEGLVVFGFITALMILGKV